MYYPYSKKFCCVKVLILKTINDFLSDLIKKPCMSHSDKNQPVLIISPHCFTGFCYAKSADRKTAAYSETTTRAASKIYVRIPPALELMKTSKQGIHPACMKLANQRGDRPPPPPLVFVSNLPFCDTVCFYCACNKIITKNRDHAAALPEKPL